ncbi:uncharacterized protein TNCV_1111411 [Trichonephila clavipes]|nr:uncharacterized protein TNCV_1111411 [Trichonephila clavipes]
MIREWWTFDPGPPLQNSCVHHCPQLQKSVAFLGFWTVRTVLNHISGQVFDEGHGESGVLHSARWHDGDWMIDGIREAWLRCFVWMPWIRNLVPLQGKGTDGVYWKFRDWDVCSGVVLIAQLPFKITSFVTNTPRVITVRDVLSLFEVLCLYAKVGPT